jgi:hypothetical protein
MVFVVDLVPKQDKLRKQFKMAKGMVEGMAVL